MKVFYRDEMVAESLSYSPSAAKPAKAVRSWLERGFPIEIVRPEPVTVEQLCRAHSAEYVRGVLSGELENGFGNRSMAVARSLPFTSGAMCAAAREAIVSPLRIACAPVSGFHHAGHDYGGGFCTFNGLMVAALDLLESGVASKVGILDCDQHFGDGTEDILAALGERRVKHFTAGARRWDAEEFLDELPFLVERIFGGCDVLLYQAGADPHVDDPLGGWMTTEQLARRDRIVFEVALRIGVPVAWNLAGGYQRDDSGSIAPVLRIHDNTMMAALQAAACRGA